MEAEKLHNLSSISWRSRNAGGVVLRTRRRMVQVTVDGRRLSQLNQSGREDAFPFSLSFCSIQALTGLDDALLSRNTLKNTPRNYV